MAVWTTGSAWFSGGSDVKGTLAPGMYADLAVLSEDLMNVPEEDICRIPSVMTAVGGGIVFADAEFADRSPPLPPARPDWSAPANHASPATRPHARTSAPAVRRTCGADCGDACHLHGHDHFIAWNTPIPARDARDFRGALGCSCFAF